MIVWDRAVRILHWVLVGAVALSAASTLVFFSAHQPAGYAALAAVVIRCVWGCVGAPRASYARFAQFIRGPRATFRYLRQLARNREPRYIGHNPLGGWMVIAWQLRGKGGDHRGRNEAEPEEGISTTSLPSGRRLRSTAMSSLRWWVHLSLPLHELWSDLCLI